MDDLPFAELLRRVRSGDSEAAQTLVRCHESAIRVAIRTRMSDPTLRRQLDSVDVCQSVLASFFLRAAAGQYDLHEPAQLVALLSKMARNKLAMHARRHFQKKRDVRRVSSLADGVADAIADSADPFRHVVGREMLDRAYSMMDDEVRQIADRRLRGEGWTGIASVLGGTADGRRKQYERAMDRIGAALQIE